MKTLLLTHMGSPGRLADIPEFLENIFLDRDMMKLPFQAVTGRFIARLRLPKAVRHYVRIGGTSPLAELTYSIAGKLSRRMKDADLGFEVAFTHAKPRIGPGTGAGTLVFPLYPQYSSALTGGIEKKLPAAKVLKSWHMEPEFLECITKRISDAVKGLEPSGTALLFLAHGLPLSVAGKGDPYIEQVEEMYRELSSRFKDYEARLAYIGKAGPAEWTGPQAEKELENIKGKSGITAVYLSMPVDNVETLYDIDIRLKNKALKLGFRSFARAGSPNDSDDFVSAVEKIIRRRLL